MIKVNASDIKVNLLLDDCPDLSWLGTFGTKPETDQAIKHNGGRNTLPWFNPGNAGEDYEDEYCQQDYERIMGYENGDWYMMGVRAKITLTLPEFKENALQRLGRRLGLLKRVHKSWSLHEFNTPGLWGVESDSDYFLEVWIEEVYSLVAQLRQLNIKVKNDHAGFLTVDPPFDSESVITLSDRQRADLDRALAAGPFWAKRFGRWIVRLLDSRYAKTQAEIAVFNAA